MKRSWNLIAVLVAMCLLVALVSFCLPGQSGMVFSYLTISLASLVGLLCIRGMIHFYDQSR